MVDFKRDRWGRPLIMVDGKETAYTRISSYGQILEDQTGLTRWKLRTVVSGVAQRQDLVSLAAANVGNDRKLDELAQQFLDAGGASRAANTGTAIHEVLAQLDSGAVNKDDVPDQFMPYAKAWIDTLDAFGFEVVPELVEIPLVNDKYKAAGSSDNFLLRTSDGLLVAVDKKTGKQISQRPLAYMVQLALYATSHEYDVATGERKALPNVDMNVAYIAHIPANGDTCTMYEIDLQYALQLCDLAQQVKLAQSTNAKVSAVAPPVNNGRQLLLDRVAAIRDAGHAQLLAAKWPTGVPTFKNSTNHSNSELDAIRKAVEQVEREYEMPFKVEKTDTVAEPTTPTAKPAKKPKVAIDEGPDVDAPTIGALRKHIKSQPEEIQLLLAQWAKEASKSGGSLSLSAKPSQRRFEIARLMLTLAKSDNPAQILNKYVEVQQSIGATLALLDKQQAQTINNETMGE